MQTYITGMGVVAQSASNVSDFFFALCEGRLLYSSLAENPRFDLHGFRTTVGGSISLNAQLEMRDSFGNADLSACELYAAWAVRDALKQAGLYPVPKDMRIGLVLGTNFGNAGAMADLVRAIAEAKPTAEIVNRNLFYPTAKKIASVLGINGEIAALSLSCASGVAVMLHARSLLRDDATDAIVAVGADELDPYVFSGLHALRAMSPENLARPWDKDRKGAIFAEGAAAVVITNKPQIGSRPLAILRGGFQNNDAFHLSAPDTTAAGITALMTGALNNAKISPSEVSFINLHGTGTPYNDKIETKAIENVFGDCAAQVPVTANKGALAHLMGAAGIAETVATVMSLSTGILPHTANLQNQDPELNLNIVKGSPLKGDFKIAMKNSFGFGGVNACAVLEKYYG